MKIKKLTPKPKPPVQDMNAVYRFIGAQLDEKEKTKRDRAVVA